VELFHDIPAGKLRNAQSVRTEFSYSFDVIGAETPINTDPDNVTITLSTEAYAK